MSPASSAKPRPSREVLMLVLQPIADRGVALLARTSLDPRVVVAAHGLAGAAAALLLAPGRPASLAGAAALLFAKVLLDNMDGGLARATGRVTESGRYLDTLVDLAVNAALFAALGVHAGAAAWPAFVLLTLILSLDHNLEARHREAWSADRGPARTGAPRSAAPDRLLPVLRRAYAVLLGWQDRGLRALDDWALARTLRAVGRAPGAPHPDERRSWNDRFSTATLVNLGLSTQLTLLATLALVGRPGLYVTLVYAQAAYVAAVQAVRVVRFRRSLRARPARTA